VISLLIDVNLDGQAERMHARLQSEEWVEYFDLLDIHFLYFHDVGLDRDDPDSLVWQQCQEHGYWLFTANRNQNDDDSLESMMRREGNEHSLPVFTVSDAKRMMRSTPYLDRIVEKLLNYLLTAEALRGSGRLFLP